MWLFTRYGFYSATVSRVDTEKIQIRARDPLDLEKLQAFAGPDFDLSETIVTPHSDYRYRSLIPVGQFPALMAKIAADVDYSNFKDQIQDPGRHNVYLDVWSTMLRVQTGTNDRLQYRIPWIDPVQDGPAEWEADGFFWDEYEDDLEGDNGDLES